MYIISYFIIYWKFSQYFYKLSLILISFVKIFTNIFIKFNYRYISIKINFFSSLVPKTLNSYTHHLNFFYTFIATSSSHHYSIFGKRSKNSHIYELISIHKNMQQSLSHPHYTSKYTIVGDVFLQYM